MTLRSRKEYEDEGHQERVRSYFENNAIAPSPCVNTGISGKRTVECQTRISLPLDFNLEAILGM